MNKGGIAIRLINFAKLFTGRYPGRISSHQCSGKYAYSALFPALVQQQLLPWVLSIGPIEAGRRL